MRGCRTDEEDLFVSFDEALDGVCGNLLLATARRAADFQDVSALEAAIEEIVQWGTGGGVDPGLAHHRCGGLSHGYGGGCSSPQYR